MGYSGGCRLIARVRLQRSAVNFRAPDCNAYDEQEQGASRDDVRQILGAEQGAFWPEPETGYGRGPS